MAELTLGQQIDYLTLQDMGVNTIMQTFGTVYAIEEIDSTYQGKTKKSIRVTFALPQFGNRKVNAFMSMTYTPTSKLGLFVNLVYNQLPETLNTYSIVNDCLGKTFGLMVTKKKFPTVTEIIGLQGATPTQPETQQVLPQQPPTQPSPPNQTVMSVASGTPTPVSPPTQPVNSLGQEQPPIGVTPPINCSYCNKPLPSNPGLCREVVIEGITHKLHFECYQIYANPAEPKVGGQ